MNLLSPSPSTSPIQEGLMLLQGNDPVAIGVNSLEMTPRIGWQFLLLELPILVSIPVSEPVSVDRKGQKSDDCDQDERFH